jgi:uncharacterized protein YcfL
MGIAKSSWTCLAMLALLLAGCASNAPVSDPHVLIDKSIKKLVAVGPPNIRYTPDGIMELSLQVQNKTAKRIAIQYQFEYFDRDSHRIDTVLSKWSTDFSAPRELIYLQSTAPGQRAQDYRIKLRKGD